MVTVEGLRVGMSVCHLPHRDSGTTRLVECKQSSTRHLNEFRDDVDFESVCSSWQALSVAAGLYKFGRPVGP